MLTVAAIAKNEGKYIVEWLAYHFAIGVDRFIIFSNESEDDQLPLLRKVSSADPRLIVIDWPSPSDVSPQIAAYRDALMMISTEWVSFFDIDEFMVLNEHQNINEYLNTVPPDVSSVHVNWRNFGSGGLVVPNYQMVTRAFMQGAHRGWSNHRHFKSMARARYVNHVSIHNMVASQGRRTLSDFGDFDTENDGMSSRVIHSPLRLHHYQSKTFAEFSARMRRGDANFPPGHRGRNRDESQHRFQQIDLNDVYDDTIRRFDNVVDLEVARLSRILSS
jgi:Glycosyltransferase family 92